MRRRSYLGVAGAAVAGAVAGCGGSAEVVCPPTTRAEAERLVPEPEGFRVVNIDRALYGIDPEGEAAPLEFVAAIHEGPEGIPYYWACYLWPSTDRADHTAFPVSVSVDKAGVDSGFGVQILGGREQVTLTVNAPTADYRTGMRTLYEATPCFDQAHVVRVE